MSNKHEAHEATDLAAREDANLAEMDKLIDEGAPPTDAWRKENATLEKQDPAFRDRTTERMAEDLGVCQASGEGVGDAAVGETPIGVPLDVDDDF